MITKIIQFLRSEDGPTSVEYAVMLALIVGMCMTAIAVAGGPVAAFWEDSDAAFGNALDQ